MTDETRYDRCIRLIKANVALLNEALGLSTKMDADLRTNCVTFGYIGNCSPGGKNDYRSWSVFLPHPNRYGTADDRIGSFRTGDVEGAQATLVAIAASVKIARLASSLVAR